MVHANISYTTYLHYSNNRITRWCYISCCLLTSVSLKRHVGLSERLKVDSRSNRMSPPASQELWSDWAAAHLHALQSSVPVALPLFILYITKVIIPLLLNEYPQSGLKTATVRCPCQIYPMSAFIPVWVVWGLLLCTTPSTMPLVKYMLQCTLLSIVSECVHIWLLTNAIGFQT